MLEIRAIVIQVHGNDASVKPVGTGGCGHCTTEGGCGSGTLSQLFCSSKPRHFEVRNDIQAKVGDEVQISLPEGILLRGAIKMYLLPLFLLLVGGVAGVNLASDVTLRDAYATVGAITGLLLGFVLAKLSPAVGQPVASSIVTIRSNS